VKAKFFTNVWGYSELVLEAAGQAAAGVIAPFPVAPWGMNSAAGAKTISAIAGGKPRTSYYIAAVCSVFYVKEALEWADKNGGITGEKVRQGMYQKKDWVPKGLEGQCAPATWTASDHRSMTSATLWEGQFRDGKPAWKHIGDVAMPREEKWFGR
jgi:branched-chain amino acid transport system substrate-binding protein